MKKYNTPKTQEQYSSHIPAVVLLMQLGWGFISRADCLEMRSSNRDVLLKPILKDFLQQKRFEYKGELHALSIQAIEQIIRELSPSLNQGLLAANEVIYDKLTLGVTVTEFMPDGKKHSPTIAIIDWANVENNEFHVSEEFEVLSSNGIGTRRPDVVCFVNGIPLVVIEAKRPDSSRPNHSMVDEGISQMIRNQRVQEIPHLFMYSQLLFSVSMIDARYATTGTQKKFWSKWSDEQIIESEFFEVKNRRLSVEQQNALFLGKAKEQSDYFQQLWEKPMMVTEQDKLMVSLLDRKRFLEFVQYFILFDRKAGKIAARYQQVFGIKDLLERVRGVDAQGSRKGGVLWHTTGSGKSFTMVFLCKAMLLDEGLQECRFLVVTDRIDLEKQLAKTFYTSGALGGDIAGKKKGDELAKVRTGKQLAKRIGVGNERIIFSIINKFASATKLPECYNASQNIIVLVDEGHRSQGGENHERMRKALPNAAFVAFTGTPLTKDDKTENKFGSIVHAYTMKRAVEDGTVTPLLYEERKPKLDINKDSIDNWFEKITVGLSDQQSVDLKKKFSSKGAVYEAKQRIELIAWDISVHFDQHFKQLNNGLKGQLACRGKYAAIRYKKALDEVGMVTSRVIMSPPDTSEGYDSIDDEKLPEIQQWWKENVIGDPEEYERQVIDDFATDGEPDLLIVVNKLLTGFDEPRNAVLYIDKSLEKHNLIQAIARVNRLHEEKQYGLLIDYQGILVELDTAIAEYQDLEERTQGSFDIDDIDGLYRHMDSEYKQLPMLHDQLWAMFDSVQNRTDIEAFRSIFMPKFEVDEDGVEIDVHQKLREDFYAALRDFGLCLKVALSSRSFFYDPEFSEEKVSEYKQSLQWFIKLRTIVRRDAAETVDYSVYEKQLSKLVDKHISGNRIEEPEGVYLVTDLHKEDDSAKWNDEKASNEADTIKTRVKKTIEQKLEDDPYAKAYFSELLKQAIEEVEAMFDHPYKQYVVFKDLEKKLESREVSGLPEELSGNKHAQAYYGVFKLTLSKDKFASLISPEDAVISYALQIEEIVNDAVAENSLNIEGIESAIKVGLMPILFKAVGIDKAKEISDEIVRISRFGVDNNA
ncbi:MAG: type I restriction endonuclease subunit R [Arenicella sp.]